MRWLLLGHEDGTETETETEAEATRLAAIEGVELPTRWRRQPDGFRGSYFDGG